MIDDAIKPLSVWLTLLTLSFRAVNTCEMGSNPSQAEFMASGMISDSYCEIKMVFAHGSVCNAWLWVGFFSWKYSSSLTHGRSKQTTTENINYIRGLWNSVETDKQARGSGIFEVSYRKEIINCKCVLWHIGADCNWTLCGLSVPLKLKVFLTVSLLCNAEQRLLTHFKM